MQKSILYHIDVNSAFLSWEAAKRLNENKDETDIRTIPAAIGGNEEMRRGIVLAKSPSAKKYGVRTGEPLAQARRKCPILKVFPPDYELYVENSGKFIDLLSRYAPSVEPYSIDEAFCDMTGTTGLYGDPVAFAQTLKNKIRDELGFTVNIGVSSNRLLAKMASDFEKPDLVHTLYPDEISQKLWPLPIENLFFVGKSSAKKLRSLGITTIGELAHTDHAMIVSALKTQGDTIWNYANGIQTKSLSHLSPANKGYGNSMTIPFDVTDSDTAKRVLLSLCETVGARLRAAKAYVSVVQVQIVDSEFHHHSHQTTLSSSTNITEIIYGEACRLFDSGWKHSPIRQLGVYTSRATTESYEQYDLFDMEKNERLSRLNSAVDQIRGKYGEDSIKRACFLDHSQAEKEFRHMTGGMSKAKRTRQEDAKPPSKDEGI